MYEPLSPSKDRRAFVVRHWPLVALLLVALGLSAYLVADANAATSSKPTATSSVAATNVDPPPDPVFPNAAVRTGIRAWMRFLQTNYPSYPSWHVVSTTLDDAHYHSVFVYQGDYDHIDIQDAAEAATISGPWVWNTIVNNVPYTCYRSDSVYENRWVAGPSGSHQYGAWIDVPNWVGGFVCPVGSLNLDNLPTIYKGTP